MAQEDELETLVTARMREEKGVWGSGTASYPISESDIRKWAIASYWPEQPPRRFWDEEYAKTTPAGGIVAPEDFNPFAWPVERPSMGGFEIGSGMGQRVMNGGQVETFGVPMRPGDVITQRTRLKEWNERTTRLGLTLFSDSETEWRNQHGELVKTRISTIIRY